MPATDATSTDEHERQLAEVLATLAARLQSGKPIDINRYADRFPHLRQDLEHLLPTMTKLAELGSSRPEMLEDARHLDDSAGESLGTLGDFRLIREIGRGGMGVVYAAQQISLNRTVAVKLLPFAAMLDSHQLQRFKNEAQAAASLEHPSIVNVFFVGNERGVHFYAMRYVEGRSLAEAIQQLRQSDPKLTARLGSVKADGERVSTRDSCQKDIGHDCSQTYDTQAIAELSTQRSRGRSSYFRSVAELVAQAADALHYSHQMGVVHRDIKPSNLLLDRNGRMWITDFGLASTQATDNVTMSGDILGTLPYMSPEQAEGHAVVDHRTDVYSLGVVLYELLTLQCPFSGNNRNQLLRDVIEHRPRPLRQVDRSIPVDLETIVLRATGRQPSDRYADAGTLAEDLRRFLNHQPIKAKRSSRARHLRRWVWRNRLVSTLGLIVLLLLMALAVGGPLLAVKNAKLADKEAAARKQAIEDRRRLKDILHEALVKTSEAVEERPGLEHLQRDLLREATRYYEQILRERPSDADVQFEVGVAYRELAAYQYRLGTRVQARTLFEKSRRLLSPLAMRDRYLPDALRELVFVHLGLTPTASDVKSALEHAQRAKQLAQELVERSDSTEHRVLLLETRTVLGRRLRRVGRFSEAKRELQAAVDYGRELMISQESEDIALSWLPAVRGLTDSLCEAHQFEEGERLCRESCELISAHSNSASLPAWLQERVALQHISWASALNRLRRAHEAEMILQEPLGSLETLLHKSPDRRLARTYLGYAHYELGLARSWNGDMESAVTSWSRALGIQRQVLAKHEQSLGLGTVMHALGQLLWRVGDRDESRLLFDQAEKFFQQHAQADSAFEPHFMRGLATVLALRPDEQRDPVREVEVAGSILQHEDGRAWQLLAIAQLRNEQWRDAKESLVRSISLRSGGDAIDWFLFAIAHAHLGDRSDAEHWFTKAVDAKQAPIDMHYFVVPQQLDELHAEAKQIISESLKSEIR